jgi:hypothetical protein
MAKRGRPTKYRKEYIDIAYKACREKGCTDAQLAKVLNANVRTIARWKESYVDFRHTIKKGKDEFDTRIVEEALRKRAVGFTCIEETQHVGKTVDPDTGEPRLVTIKKVIKEVPPDSTAMIFWLKNRQPKRWRDKREHQVDASVTVLKPGEVKKPKDSGK